MLRSETSLCGKSLTLCYLLVLAGHLGIHRFYMKQYKSASLQLLLFVLAATTYMAARTCLQDLDSEMLYYGLLAVFWIIAGGLSVWIVIDLFLIPGMVKRWNERVERDLKAQIIALRDLCS